jgi:hypothetical protein
VTFVLYERNESFCFCGMLACPSGAANFAAILESGDVVFRGLFQTSSYVLISYSLANLFLSFILAQFNAQHNKTFTLY